MRSLLNELVYHWYSEHSLSKPPTIDRVSSPQSAVEQFRLRGELIMVTHESTDARLIRQRTGLWKSISDAARAQFSWPTPGSDRPPEADDEKDFRCPADINAVSDNFVLMLLRPNYIDHLRLKGFPQKRVLWRRGDQKRSGRRPNKAYCGPVGRIGTCKA